MTIQLIGQFLPLLLLAIFAACILLIVREATKPKVSSASRVKQKRIPVYPPKKNDWRHPAPAASKPDSTGSPIKRMFSFTRNPQVPKAARRQGSRSKSAAPNIKQNELLGLLHGDQATAQRLLSHAKQNNPGMGETWYFEKVIADIVRDRR